MKTKILLLAFSAVCAMILFSAFNGSEISSLCDAPLVGDHTGAPGETNCTGCHPGTVNNSGPGTVTFDVGGGITQYVPGKTYLCTVSIVQTSISKMGYACTSLRSSNNTTTGIFSLTEPNRTRLYTLGGRNYVSHNRCGADASTAGSNQWTFNWQAPSTNVGTITLYIGALATNHNHATSGDYAYTKSVKLTAFTTSVNEIQAEFGSINLFPNPTSENMELSYENFTEGKTIVSLFNLQGELIKVLFSEKQSPGKQNLKLDLKSGNILKGTYLIRISNEHGLITKKITLL